MTFLKLDYIALNCVLILHQHNVVFSQMFSDCWCVRPRLPFWWKSSPLNILKLQQLTYVL